MSGLTRKRVIVGGMLVLVCGVALLALLSSSPDSGPPITATFARKYKGYEGTATIPGPPDGVTFKLVNTTKVTQDWHASIGGWHQYMAGRLQPLETREFSLNLLPIPPGALPGTTIEVIVVRKPSKIEHGYRWLLARIGVHAKPTSDVECVHTMPIPK